MQNPCDRLSFVAHGHDLRGEDPAVIAHDAPGEGGAVQRLIVLGIDVGDGDAIVELQLGRLIAAFDIRIHDRGEDRGVIEPERVPDLVLQSHLGVDAAFEQQP